jgi:hypothetical protein
MIHGRVTAFATIACLLGAACLHTGCVSTGSQRTAADASDRAAVGTVASLGDSASAWLGVWALTDQRNSTFNVRLSEGGSAISTWSGGPLGVIGERGSWTVREGMVSIEWTNGWIDELKPGRYGIDHEAWGPGDRRGAQPRTYGKAVLLRDASAEFLGVWQMRGVLPGDPQSIAVALQSDGMAFKGVGELRYGCWATMPRGARITWANGWYDELTREVDGWVVRTWTPSADRVGPSSATNRVRRIE